MDLHYFKSQPKNWDPDLDIPWSRGEDLQKAAFKRLPHAYFDFLGNSSFWRLMPQQGRRKLHREILDWTVSQLLYGELLSRDICRVVAASSAAPRFRRMAALQAREEEKHRRVFVMYREKIIGRKEPLIYDDWFLKFRRCLEAEPRWEMKLLGLQVIGEWLFFETLLRLNRSCRWPALGRLLRLVMSDEARHHGFGMEHMGRLIQSLGPETVKRAQDFTFKACCSFISEFPIDVFKNAGLSAAQCRIAQRQYARRLRPKTHFVSLAARLNRLGLAPPRLRVEYAALGLL